MAAIDLGFRLVHSHNILPNCIRWKHSDGTIQITTGGPRRITFVKVGSIVDGIMPTAEDLKQFSDRIRAALDARGSGIVICHPLVEIEQLDI